MNLLHLLPVAALIVSCTPQDTSPSSRSAEFPEYPQKLFSAFETDCAGPGNKYVKTDRNTVECRELLPPDMTAYLILNFDGYPQNLPQIVTYLHSSKIQAGYRVDAELFFLVPQKSGKTVKIPVQSEMVNRDFSRLYSEFGGNPI